jgi:starch synthase
MILPDEKIRVWFFAAEAEPFVKIGGLGDVSGVLPKAINRLDKGDFRRGAHVQLVLPYHQAIRERNFPVDRLGEFTLAHLPEPYTVEVFRNTAPDLTTYLLNTRPALFDDRVYSSDDMKDGNKYLAFSLAAMQLPAWLNQPVDLLHVNDWHTGFAAYALKQIQQRSNLLPRVKSLLTLHNLPYMGHANREMIASYGYHPSRSPQLPWWGRTLPLPLGLLAAERIVPVSSGYAHEILTPEYGCGLDPFLTARAAKITGLVNGIDTDLWNPETDPCLAARYKKTNLELRAVNKGQIHSRLALPEEPNIALMVTVSRFDRQKGIDLILDAVPLLERKDWQLVMLGTGDPQLEAQAKALEAGYPNQIRVITRFDNELAHLLYAGGDLFLMPSRYEPCGLSQMIAMRYGCIPLARRTGGLVDTIRDAHESSGGTGYLFSGTDAAALAVEIQSDLVNFKHKDNWKEMQMRGMKEDFSWNSSAKKYLQLYNELVHTSSQKKEKADEK